MMRALYKEKLINSYGIEFQNKVCDLLLEMMEIKKMIVL